jgi:hypothetical protein
MSDHECPDEMAIAAEAGLELFRVRAQIGRAVHQEDPHVIIAAIGLLMCDLLEQVSKADMDEDLRQLFIAQARDLGETIVESTKRRRNL